MTDELEIRAVRERVARLEAEMQFLYKHFNLTFMPSFELDPADAEVAEWLKKKDDMKAVAAYRAIHKVSLPEAKAAVDEIRAGLGLGF